MPNNKKEIYFRLTSSGEDIYKIHEELHKDFSKRDKEIFEQITDSEYACVFRFINLYSSHLDNELDKMAIDIDSGLADKF